MDHIPVASTTSDCKSSFWCFTLGIKPIWWYPFLRSRKEKILQLCNLAIKSLYLAGDSTNYPVPFMCSVN